MKKLLSILMLLVAIVTGAWADQTYHTVTPNVENTQYEMYALYSMYSSKAVKSDYSAWVSGDVDGQNSSSYEEPAGWLDGASGKPGVGFLQVKDTKTITFYITNCVGVVMLSKSGGDRYCQLSVKDASTNTEVSTIKQNGNTLQATDYGTPLDPTKNYIVTLSGTANSNQNFHQIRFEAPSAPSVPTLTGAWKIGEDDVTGETADVVQGATAPSIPTFTVDATSGTPTSSDYQVAYEETGDEGIFTYTDGVPTGISTANAGSATITATLTTKDETKYLTPETNTFTYEVSISAASAPSINVSGTPAEAVKVGTTVTLTATAAGVPTPTITWYNGSDEAVATVEGTELAYTVPTTTAGTYTFYAVASNGVEPNAISAVQTVVVKEQVATPTFTPNGAYFQESQQVAITCTTADATVKYSTDNGETWTDYTAAFSVTATTTIKAKAVKDGCIDSETATATFTKIELTPQADVTGATTWDWADVTNTSSVELDKGSKALNNVDVTFANIPAYGYTAVTGLAAQDALLMNGQRAYNNVNDSKHCQVNYLKFNTTVAGKVTVEYANTGGNAARTVNVNGTKGTKSVTNNVDYETESFDVVAGEVEIKGVQVSDDAAKMLRIRKVTFAPTSTITLNSNGYATYSKATDFEFAGAKAYKMNLNYTGGTLQGTEVTGKIKAGEGILFKGEAGATVAITETTGASALADNSLVGTTPATGDAPTPDYTSYKYFVLKGKTFVPYQTATTFGAGKAFFQVDIDAQLTSSLELVFDGEATAINNVNANDNANSVAPVKVIKNGKLYIGNYNVAGQLVK